MGDAYALERNSGLDEVGWSEVMPMSTGALVSVDSLLAESGGKPLFFRIRRK